MTPGDIIITRHGFRATVLSYPVRDFPGGSSTVFIEFDHGTRCHMLVNSCLIVSVQRGDLSEADCEKLLAWHLSNTRRKFAEWRLRELEPLPELVPVQQVDGSFQNEWRAE